MEKKVRAATESSIFLLLVAGILIAINVLSAVGVAKRFDVTKAERFTLSKGSGSLLRSMKQTLQVDAYVTRGLPKLDAFVRDLRDLLQEYKDAGQEKFDYQIIDSKDEEQKRIAKEAGLIEQPFGEASETDQQAAAVTQGFMGLVFKYGADKDKIPFLPPDRTEGLEFWITNKIREVRDRGDQIKHKIGVLTGHDEIKLSENNLVPSNMGRFSMQQVIQQNFPFYTLEDVDLKDGDVEIDAGFDGLLITQPSKDLNEKELRRIDQFLLKGKALALFVSAVEVKAGDAIMQAQLNLHKLDQLMNGYGIEIGKDVILDFGRSFRVNMLTQGGIASARFPQFLDVQDDARFLGNEQLLDVSFPGFFRIPELVVPFASSIVLHPEKQPELTTAKIIARSTPRSVRVQDERVDLRPFQQWRPKGEWAQYGIAAQVEGTIHTAFPSGDKQGIETPEKSSAPARIFILASSQFLANPFARAGNGPDMPQVGMMPFGGGGDEQLQQLAGPYAQQALTGTILAFKNTLDWLSGDMDLLAVSAKILTEPSLVYGEISKPNFDPNETEEQLKRRDEELRQARKKTQMLVMMTLLLGIPVLFSGYGVMRWRARLARRSHLVLA
ncbi:hypothetical protein BCY86_08500 [Pajaroellobacter abortibovis]|uniref:Uncharacterized protein n=2 Tax=Pajaroellobacter abortibovis TaxID=1882918 RepID=A0A1L6MZH6_9BACT|nr:hypothetical protein BCY86_08500 [Pajaroellobacter abortibovis]